MKFIIILADKAIRNITNVQRLLLLTTLIVLGRISEFNSILAPNFVCNAKNSVTVNIYTTGNSSQIFYVHLSEYQAVKFLSETGSTDTKGFSFYFEVWISKMVLEYTYLFKSQSSSVQNAKA